MGKLDGRIAVVAGSDSGIGKATAEEFAKEGADVVVTFFHDRAGAGQAFVVDGGLEMNMGQSA